MNIKRNKKSAHMRRGLNNKYLSARATVRAKQREQERLYKKLGLNLDTVKMFKQTRAGKKLCKKFKAKKKKTSLICVAPNKENPARYDLLWNVGIVPTEIKIQRELHPTFTVELSPE